MNRNKSFETRAPRNKTPTSPTAKEFEATSAHELDDSDLGPIGSLYLVRKETSHERNLLCLAGEPGNKRWLNIGLEFLQILI